MTVWRQVESIQARTVRCGIGSRDVTLVTRELARVNVDFRWVQFLQGALAIVRRLEDGFEAQTLTLFIFRFSNLLPGPNPPKFSRPQLPSRVRHFSFRGMILTRRRFWPFQSEPPPSSHFTTS